MKAAQKAFSYEVRVAYADTDQGGIAHHAAYWRWLEAARIELLRLVGLSYRDLEANAKVALPVVDTRLRYRKPARFDDVLAVECAVANVGRASVRFDYRVVRAQELLAEASVTLACVTLPDLRVCSLPAAARAACERAREQRGTSPGSVTA